MHILEDCYTFPLKKIEKDELLVTYRSAQRHKFSDFEKYMGAKNTKLFGRAGRLYIFPTTRNVVGYLPYSTLQYYAGKLLFSARKHPDIKYIIPHFKTPVYTDEVLAALFKEYKDLDNIYMNKVFFEFIERGEFPVLETECGFKFEI